MMTLKNGKKKEERKEWEFWKTGFYFLNIIKDKKQVIKRQQKEKNSFKETENKNNQSNDGDDIYIEKDEQDQCKFQYLASFFIIFIKHETLFYFFFIF